jgi:RNA polymerase sigma-70 factor (ECF subfamily)
MTNSSEAAKDITPEVFLTQLRQPNRFDATRGQMRPFLLDIARNLILKSYRREKNRWTELDEEQFTTQTLDIIELEIAELISAAVQALPPLQREVLILAH